MSSDPNDLARVSFRAVRASEPSGGPRRRSVERDTRMMAGVLQLSTMMCLCAWAGRAGAESRPQVGNEASSTASAREELPSGWEAPRLVPRAILDVYYAYHAPAPAGRWATLASSSGRHNDLAVGLAAIGVKLEHTRLSGTVLLRADTNSNVVSGVGYLSPWRFLQEAWVGYRAGDVGLEIGLLPSQVGNESFVTAENWAYTRSMMRDLLPYFVLGARGWYRPSASWTLSLAAFNGWSDSFVSNQGKTGQLRALYQPSETFSLSNAVMVGSEDAGDEHARLFYDLVATWKPTTRWSVAGEGWVVREQGATYVDASQTEADTGSKVVRDPMVFAGAAWIRLGLTETLSVAVRGEAIADRVALLTGRGAPLLPARSGDPIARFLYGGTVTLAWSPHPLLTFKLEGMHRRASEPYFAGGRLMLAPSMGDGPSSFSDAKRFSTTVVGAATFAM